MAATAWDSRLGRRIALPLRNTRVHPNHVTTAGMLAGLAAAALYAHGSPRAANWGAGLYVLSAILDHADGALARLSGRCSGAGQAYDRVADLLVRLALFAGVGCGLRHGALGDGAIALAAAADVGVVATLVLRSATARRRGWEAIPQPTLLGLEFEDILYVIAPITWAGGRAPFLVGAAVGSPLFALWTAWIWWREPTARPAPPSRLPDTRPAGE